MNAPVIFMRAVGNVLTALDFTILSVTLVVLLQRTDIGHRTMLRMLLIYSMMHSVSSFVGVFSVYQHLTMFSVTMRFITALILTASVVYIVVKNWDVIRTLQVSEYVDRLRKDKAADNEQARLNMTSASWRTRMASEALVRR